jgi:hypothetical protein
MKTLKCDLCDETADGETFEDWMQALRPHYMAVHADIMKDSGKTEQDMMNWMAENKARFDAAWAGKKGEGNKLECPLFSPCSVPASWAGTTRKSIKSG